VDEAGCVVPRMRGVASRRSEAVVARMADLDRKIIFRRGPVTMVGRDFVGAAANEAAPHP